MKFVAQVLAILLLGYIAEIMLPWYSIAFVAFIAGYWLHTGWNFISGFVGVAALWGIKLFKITSVAASDLADKVAIIFPVKETWILIAVTLFLGGLIGGLATTTGGLLRRKKRQVYY
jgi:hypothetical protein